MGSVQLVILDVTGILQASNIGIFMVGIISALVCDVKIPVRLKAEIVNRSCRDRCRNSDLGYTGV